MAGRRERGNEFRVPCEEQDSLGKCATVSFSWRTLLVRELRTNLPVKQNAEFDIQFDEKQKRLNQFSLVDFPIAIAPLY